MNRAKTMIAIKVLVQSTIVPAVSVYKTQCDLNDNKKDHLYDHLIDVAQVGCCLVGRFITKSSSKILLSSDAYIT